VNAALNGASGLLGNVNPMGGILGNTLGESSAETQARIDEAKKTATDLSGLVRRKKEKASNGDSNGTDAAKAPVSNGKRKAEDIEEEEITDSSAKKAKVEDVVDAKA
jgi:HAT1-interacting factor 1